jgi:hypothetical protein
MVAKVSTFKKIIGPRAFQQVIFSYEVLLYTIKERRRIYPSKVEIQIF